MDEERTIELLVELHEGLSRLGPGTTASTLRALSMCQGLPREPAVLDVGCGTGAQTLDLAEATGGSVTAVDLTAGFLTTLRERASAAGLASRVRTVQADMSALPFEDRSFDLVWSEGAVYSIGFDAGLAAWRRLLRPRGWLAVTELSWLVERPPSEALAFWHAEYPAIRGAQANCPGAEAQGYDVVGHFTLPNNAWQAYYGPLRQRLDDFMETHAADADAQALAQATLHEMAVHNQFSDVYGYEFYVLQRSD